jgi:hypothetical protein
MGYGIWDMGYGVWGTRMGYVGNRTVGACGTVELKHSNFHHDEENFPKMVPVLSSQYIIVLREYMLVNWYFSLV